MPFYLTNENIEATMERNPDDIFNPSDIQHPFTANNTIIRQLILKAICKVLQQEIKQVVIIDEVFTPVKSLKQNSVMAYTFAFETQISEYEIIYYVPDLLDTFIVSNESKSFQQEIKDTKTMLLSMSEAIIASLNEEDFSFLQDMQLTDLSAKSMYKQTNTFENMYVLNVLIDDQKSALYLQLDSEFSKLF